MGATKKEGHPLFSIGYEGRSIDEFVDVLRTTGVDIVVDVRLNAISRKRGFSKKALSAALKTASIKYQHERELGNPKDNRDAFRNGLPSAKARYQRHLSNGATSSFEAVAELARTQKVALLCFENEHATCHRSCITDRMQESRQHLSVVHI